MKAVAYGIQIKTTGQWFCGFRSDHSVIWGPPERARTMPKGHAECQILLFERADLKFLPQPQEAEDAVE